MHYIVAGGTGFVGQYLIQRWLDRGIQITVIGRDPQKSQHLFENRVQGYSWAEFGERSQELLPHARLLLNLAGANISNKRWSAAQKKEIFDSRINTTRELTSLCSALGDKSPPFLCASAIGVYGLQTNENFPILPPAFSEDTPIDFTQSPDFLAYIARQWEITTSPAKAHGVRTVNLRFGVVLGRDGGVLAALKRPYQWGLGGVIGSGQQPFSWIHIADLAEIIDFILHHTHLAGPINLTAPHTVTQREFAQTLAQALHRPCFFKMPAFLVKLVLGEMGDELLLKGQHVVPTRLIEAGYVFQYPKLNLALNQLYKN